MKNLILNIFTLFLTQAILSQTIDLDLPNRIDSYRISSIGNNFVEVYSNAEKTKFFYQPILIVDWEDYNKRLLKLNNTSSDILSIPIRISFTDINVENEIIFLLNRNNYNVKNVSPLPHTFFQITASIKGKKQIINESQIPTIESGISLQRKTSIASPQRFNIKGTFSELSHFYENRFLQTSLNGLLFSQGFSYSSDYISGIANFGNSTSIKRELFGDENNIRKNIVKGKTGSAGVAINLDGFKLGASKGSSRSTTEKINKRVVNRNYISDLITENNAEIGFTVIGNKDRSNETLNKFTTTLLNYFEKVDLEFQRKNDSEYELVSNQIAYANIGGLQLKELMKSKPELSVTADDSKSGSYAGASASSTNKGAVVYKDDIAWEFDGKDWIPSKVKMYLVSDTDLTSNIKLSAMFYNKEGKIATAVDFMYPADWLYSKEKEITLIDKDNPVGSILAFAGTRVTIPTGWRLCDGSYLLTKKNEGLFNIIGYRWGKNDKNEFALPNLQGQFLRGTDYTKKIDPDVNKRKNSIGEIGEIGSYQLDAIKEHIHSGYTSTGGKSVEHHQSNSDYPLKKWQQNSGKIIDQTSSVESRPKNVYVNYIIRVK